jgi:hypothetical protein
MVFPKSEVEWTSAQTTAHAPEPQKLPIDTHRESVSRDAALFREREKALRGEAAAHTKIVAKSTPGSPIAKIAARAAADATRDADVFAAQASTLEKAVEEASRPTKSPPAGA